MSKTGFSGVSLISIFILADLYGAKASVGLALPLLILADLLVYPAFRGHGSWAPVWRLLAPALVGLALGYFLLRDVPDGVARKIIGAIILLMVGLQALRRWHREWFDRMAASRTFGASAGVAGGVATMLANAAGPVIQLYLLSVRLPKLALIGIGARFFLLVNLLKVPLNTQLKLIDAASLMENLKLAPGVVLGVWVGRWAIHRVSQPIFEAMIVVFAVLAGVRLLLF
jgi:uncharacterized membrane protein YfcA